MSIRHTEPQTWLFVCCSHCICRLSIFVFRKVLTPNSNHLAVKHGGISWQSHTNSTEGLRTVNVVSICSMATGIIALFVAVPYVLCVIVFILICSYNFIFVFSALLVCKGWVWVDFSIFVYWEVLLSDRLKQQPSYFQLLCSDIF